MLCRASRDQQHTQGLQKLLILRNGSYFKIRKISQRALWKRAYAFFASMVSWLWIVHVTLKSDHGIMVKLHIIAMIRLVSLHGIKNLSQGRGKPYHLPRLPTMSNHSPSEPYLLHDYFSTFMKRNSRKPYILRVGRYSLFLKWCVLAPGCRVGFGEIPRRPWTV